MKLEFEFYKPLSQKTGMIHLQTRRMSGQINTPEPWTFEFYEPPSQKTPPYLTYTWTNIHPWTKNLYTEVKPIAFTLKQEHQWLQSSFQEWFWILDLKVYGTFYIVAQRALMGGNFSPIFLKFHPFKLPPKHLHHLFSSDRKLKLGEPTSKRDLDRYTRFITK